MVFSHREGSVQVLLFLAASYPVTYLRSQVRFRVIGVSRLLIDICCWGIIYCSMLLNLWPYVAIDI